MEANRRPTAVQEMFDRFYRTLETENWAQAQKELDALEKTIGPDDSELIQARVTLALEQI